MPKDPRLEVLTVEPFNAQPPLRQLIEAPVTPTALFFARNHAPIPQLEEEEHLLTLDGMVRRPLSLRVADLRANFPTVEITATLQCAGNRRDELIRVRPVPGETPWGASALSTATWRGVPLAAVLEAAGVLDGALHVAMLGRDQVEKEGKRFGFGGSIPLSRALQPDVVLAWEMNGEPLAAEHGFPLRAVVPGWIGARSVKWIGEVTVQREPSDNWYQQRAYKVFPTHVDKDSADWSQGLMLGELGLTSVIGDPADGQELPSGEVTVRGYAMAGGSRTVERVEVSADHGRSWTVAELGEGAPGTWVLWQARIRLAEGGNELVCRAWDSAAMTQPEEVAQVWNFKGYMNTAWHRVRVWVTG